MATISRLSPGQVLYTVTRQKMGNTALSRKAVHTVRVIEVDPDGKFVMASWNTNPARKYRESDVSKWKVNKPLEEKGYPDLSVFSAPEVTDDI